jgi:hypothetical protein
MYIHHKDKLEACGVARDGGRIGENKCISQGLVYVGQGQDLRRVVLFL